MKRLISWNVNGIRAAEKKGLFEWLQNNRPDILCLQETKASPDQLDEVFKQQNGYTAYFASAEKKGYSGVAVYTNEEPVSVSTLGIAEFDAEGRSLVLEYPGFVLLNCYFPNSQEEGKRLDYKIRFCDAVMEFCESVRSSGRNIVVCGDFNIAHKPIDLANPKRNEQNPGYLPEERAWMDKFTEAGYLDTFRLFCSEPDMYTWWSYRFKAREKNIGWRIDYFCTNPELRPAVAGAEILADVAGSDHCPVGLSLNA